MSERGGLSLLAAAASSYAALPVHTVGVSAGDVAGLLAYVRPDNTVEDDISVFHVAEAFRERYLVPFLKLQSGGATVNAGRVCFTYLDEDETEIVMETRHALIRLGLGTRVARFFSPKPY